MKRAAAAAITAALVLVPLAGCGSVQDDPKETAEAYMKAVSDHDCKAAAKLNRKIKKALDDGTVSVKECNEGVLPEIKGHYTCEQSYENNPDDLAFTCVSDDPDAQAYDVSLERQDGKWWTVGIQDMN